MALVISHPIQHFCPQYASLAGCPLWQFKVYFASSIGREAYHDSNFGKQIAWGNLRLDEFDHEFLSEEAMPSSPKLDAPSLDNRLAEFDPDVVIVHGYSQRVQKRARSWAQRNGRLIYYISDTEIANGRSALKTRAKTLLLRRMFARIDRVLTVGNSNELFYHECGVPPERMTRMHFSIDRSAFGDAFARRAALREEARSEFGFGASDVVVSNVGKLVPWKRQADLIHAVAALPESCPVRILLIGSGPDEESLRQLAQNLAPSQVSFAGFVTPDRLPALYAASDIYAHVSSYEPHSLAISEAIFMGLPVLVSHQCGSFGPFDDVRPGHNGFVFRTGERADLARQLDRLGGDRDLRAAFGEASRAYAVTAQERSHGVFLEDALRADGLL